MAYMIRTEMDAYNDYPRLTQTFSFMKGNVDLIPRCIFSQ